MVEEAPKKVERIENKVEEKEEPTGEQPAEQVWPKSGEKKQKESVDK